MNVGQLKAALADVPDDVEVCVWNAEYGEDDECYGVVLEGGTAPRVSIGRAWWEPDAAGSRVLHNDYDRSRNDRA
jgi:hypothetical protein